MAHPGSSNVLSMTNVSTVIFDHVIAIISTKGIEDIAESLYQQQTRTDTIVLGRVEVIKLMDE